MRRQRFLSGVATLLANQNEKSLLVLCGIAMSTLHVADRSYCSYAIRLSLWRSMGSALLFGSLLGLASGTIRGCLAVVLSLVEEHGQQTTCMQRGGKGKANIGDRLSLRNYAPRAYCHTSTSRTVQDSATSKAKGVDYETAKKWTTRMKAQLSKSPEAMEKWGTLCSLPGRGAQKNVQK
eukprot:1311105-Amphidinium_carterae.1